MSPLMIKGLIAAGGLGLGGIGIWQINNQLRLRTVQAILEHNDEEFYSFEVGEDMDGWKALAKTYRENSSSAEEKDRISGLSITGTPENEEDAKNMLKACKALAEYDADGDDFYQKWRNTKKWCIKPRANAPEQAINGVGS